MPLALTILDVDNSGKSLYVTVGITASGTYPTGGDTVDLTTLFGKGALGKVFVAGKPPLYGYGAGTSGHSYGFIPGTTLANGKMKINTAAGTELTNAAYPASITGDANIIAGFAFDLLL